MQPASCEQPGGRIYTTPPPGWPGISGGSARVWERKVNAIRKNDPVAFDVKKVWTQLLQFLMISKLILRGLGSFPLQDALAREGHL